ncbi:MAG TPA: carboxypeptidase regulatory-like domain-containing protein [Aridibacter sp.]|nr:carboxypeptidase regulatory-like domain-containing protein [Aridibacter sp.]
MRTIFITVIFSLIFAAAAFAQSTGTIEGRVVDVTGAVIVGASVTVEAEGFQRNAVTNESGDYSVGGIPAGSYAVTIASPGFAMFTQTDVNVAANGATSVNASLDIEVVETEVTVDDETNRIDVSPDNNASAIVLNEEDIDALPDDEEDLEAALQALAGPGAGPNGGGIYVDGFSGGSLPPKETIREIRINSNPFSSEYSRLGYGRIEILTKPGTDRLRGSVEFEFEEESFNSRNPFLDTRPPYQRKEFEVRIGGPILQNRASYFLNFEYEDTKNNSSINAIVLGPNLDPLEIRSSAATPSKEFEFDPRVDFQINENNTLVVRYGFERETRDNAGIGGFNLLSRGYSRVDTEQSLRVTETAIFSPRIINETRFQYLSRRNSEEGGIESPTIRVLDAFTGGGSNVGNAFSEDDRFEVQNFTSFLLDKHSIKVGGRLRHTRTVNASPNNFAGTFTFESLDQYREAILGNAVPTQFTIAGGDPEASVSQTDFGLFAQEDWKVNQGLTLSFGLRYENQTNIDSNYDLAPRFGFAWAPFAAGGDPKTVIRGGYGLFYDRFGSNLTLQANRFNGVNQQRFIVEDPDILDDVVFTLDGVSNVPTIEQLSAFQQPQTTRVVSPEIKSPYTSQFAVSVERELLFSTTISATYLNTRTRRLLRSRNINAPIEGDRPFPEQGNIFQYEATGRLDQQQLIVNFRTRFSDHSIFANYSLTDAKGDTDGAGTFPVNQYDLTGEYGRSSLDSTHRFVIGGNYAAPWGIRLRPFVIVRSGSPFNITTGTDTNGDTLFNERPTFAELFARCDSLSLSNGFCGPATVSNFDSVIPRNYGTGPSFFAVNLRTSKAFEFGTRESGGDDSMGGGRRGGRYGGPFGGGRGRGGGGNDAKYTLEFTVTVRNLLNRTNLSSPVGNLRSPFFGKSLSTAGGWGGGSSSGNRRIELEIEFEF